MRPGRWARLAALARLGKGGSGRHVAQLGGGTAIVMVVQIGAQYLLGHWYTDDDFGVFANLTSFATVVAMVGTLRLEMAIPLADDQSEADDLARLALVLASVLSLLLVPVALWLTLSGDRVPDHVRISVQIAPFLVWASAGFAVLRGHQARKQQFRQMSDANVAGSVATAAVQLGMAGTSLHPSALGLGYGVGRMASTGMMLRHSGLPLRGPLRGALLRKFSQIPGWTLVPAVLNALTVGAVAMVMTLLYGNQFAGQFGFVQRLLSVPVALLGQAVMSVFYVRFAAMHREDRDTSAVMVRLAAVLLGIALAIFFPVTLLGREAFNLLWSDHRWDTAGIISGILAPWLLVSFASSPLSGYATVKNEVKRLFLLNWIEAGIRMPALALGIWWGGPLVGVQAYSLAGVAICVYWVLWVVRLSGAPGAVGVRVLAVPLAVIAGAWVFGQLGREWVGEVAYVWVSVVLSVVVVAYAAWSVVRALRS